MIPESKVEELRACMPLLLRERCGVEDLARPFRCPSPAHEDRHPSAKYYSDRHLVHCFGCDRTWDAFSLVGELDGVAGFRERAEALASLAGVSLDDGGLGGRPAVGRPRPRALLPPGPARAERKSLFGRPRDAGGADCAEACLEAFDALYEDANEVGRRWLRYRGLDDEDVMRHGLGFTTDPRRVMPEFRVSEPGALGFVVIPFWGEDYDRANYCMVRTICRGEARHKEWRPKGLVTPLWNEWMLSEGLDVVYVAEGLIDAMALTKLVGGVDVMALGGTSNARRLAQVVEATPKEMRPDKVIVCMDEDEEGRKAADRVCGALDRLGVANAKLPPYPGGAKDADEWLMAGRGTVWEHVPYGVGRSPLSQTLWRTRWL